MRLFKRVSARAARPDAASREPRRAPIGAERVLAAMPGVLLVAEAERQRWRGRSGMFACFGVRATGTTTHIGGADGSLARSVPRDLPGPVSLTFTDRRLVVSAEPAPGAPAVEIAAFHRTDLRWVARTGRTDDFGVHVRCSLADDSFFDVAMSNSDCSAFLAAAELAR